MEDLKENVARFHLPGLFEFYDFYKEFLALYENNRKYFYEWCDIGSIYGAPADCIWGGGRTGFGDDDPLRVLELTKKHDISARLTFSNSFLKEEHLSDKKCNRLCEYFNLSEKVNGVIIYSDLLLKYIKERYENLYFVSSTTKVITDFDLFVDELSRNEFSYVVPDFRLNKRFDKLSQITDDCRQKVEFLCNECCDIGCMDRKVCYENVSLKCLGEACEDHICRSTTASSGYSFSRAMSNPSFISISDIKDKYLPMGFTNFKIEGRGLGSAIILEMLIYYMVKPEFQINVREAIYLDSMLDLM